MDIKQATQWLSIIALGLFVIAIGLFAVNQAIEWFYKAEFLYSPCTLCGKLNPNLTLCPKEIINNNFVWNVSLP